MIGYYLYMLFVVSYFLHLPSRIPVLGQLRFDLALAACVLLYAVLQEKENILESGKLSPVTKSILVLMGYMVVTVPFVKWPGTVIRFGLNDYLKVVVFYFFTVWYVNSESKMKFLLLTFVICQGLRICEPVFLHMTEGYWGSGANERSLPLLSGGPYDVINHNQLSWLIVTTLIFIYHLFGSSPKGVKLLFLSLFPFCIYALILTGSRSGLLSLIVSIIAVLVMKRSKAKGVVLGVAVIIAAAVLIVPHVSKPLKDRYLSIIDSEQLDHRTVVGRVRGLKKTLTTIGDAPVFGHGLSTSLETNYELLGGAQPTHNLYIEILQELGVIGFIIFLIYVKRIIALLIQAKKNLLASVSDTSWLAGLVKSVQVWIIMHLFYSLSCFGLSSWEWYFFGGLSMASFRLSKELSKESLET
jgi:hypothetical protein